MKYSRNNIFGFTLVEFTVTVAVAGILTTVAVPNFTSFVQNNRLTTNANEFISSINLARSESIKRGSRVVLCKSADGTGCDTGSTGWQQGWVVFVDSDRDDSLDPGEVILRNYSVMPSGFTLVGTSAGSNFSAADNFITYDPSGYSTATNKLELLLCDARHNLSVAKGIRITASGRPNIVRGSELGSSLNCT